MSITVVLNKRGGQNSPLTDPQVDDNWSAIEAAFAQSSTANGSVTSVGLSLPNIFSVSGSPITTTGSITATLATQAANLVFAGPTTGAAAAPTFRSIVIADLPTITAAKGGTGTTGFTSGRVIISSGTDVLGVSSVTSTELGYVSGVTSAIQTQLNAKEATITTLAVNKGGTGANTAQGARVSLLPSLTGKAGKVLTVNGGETDVEWTSAAGGITSLNSQTGATQTIAIGTTGSDFAVVSSGNVHTFNLPNADTGVRGVISTGTQTIPGAKTFAAAVTLSTIAHEATDVDKFLVSNAGLVKYRTGAEVLSDIGGGTVSSVSATSNTSGSDVAVVVADPTTTPAITISIPTASDTKRGALSSADWTTFNDKIGRGFGTSGTTVDFTKTMWYITNNVTLPAIGVDDVGKVLFIKNTTAGSNKITTDSGGVSIDTAGNVEETLTGSTPGPLGAVLIQAYSQTLWYILAKM